jgi:hypothetical protein
MDIVNIIETISAFCQKNGNLRLVCRLWYKTIPIRRQLRFLYARLVNQGYTVIYCEVTRDGGIWDESHSLSDATTTANVEGKVIQKPLKEDTFYGQLLGTLIHLTFHPVQGTVVMPPAPVGLQRLTVWCDALVPSVTLILP